MSSSQEQLSDWWSKNKGDKKSSTKSFKREEFQLLKGRIERLGNFEAAVRFIDRKHPDGVNPKEFGVTMMEYFNKNDKVESNQQRLSKWWTKRKGVKKHTTKNFTQEDFAVCKRKVAGKGEHAAAVKFLDKKHPDGMVADQFGASLSKFFNSQKNPATNEDKLAKWWTKKKGEKKHTTKQFSREDFQVCKAKVDQKGKYEDAVRFLDNKYPDGMLAKEFAATLMKFFKSQKANN
eukprot:TRINITY_DN396_c0_g1_i2.p1 TRINITY_DN396_c0_g1~~TRINITY_DN396_c0_g1_i2.p1  ORF type:complete len:234 (-),score=138.53 TRINITY_DN396_c0_g1_i2:55-756(-)